jgi:hypothetical protein
MAASRGSPGGMGTSQRRIGLIAPPDASGGMKLAQVGDSARTHCQSDRHTLVYYNNARWLQQLARHKLLVLTY